MKFGCIAPSVITLPWDLHALLPDGVNALAVSLNVRNGQPGEADRAERVMQRAVDVLIDEEAKAIVVQGVPVAARRGLTKDRAALAAHVGQRGPIPIASSLEATAQALIALGAKRPLFITQYNDETNAQIVAYCRDVGVTACAAVGLGATNAAMVNALTVADYEALARRALGEHRSADGVFISARGNMLALTRALQATFNLPFVEQIRPSVWWAVTKLGGRYELA